MDRSHEEEWNASEPKSRIGGGYVVRGNPGSFRAGESDRPHRRLGDQRGRMQKRRKGKANQTTFAPMSEVHGGGFIAEQNRLIGRTAKCTIKAKKDDGQTVNIVASCATDIMLSSVQFQLNVVNQDKIQRLFPGMPDMEIYYYRCQL